MPNTINIHDIVAKQARSITLQPPVLRVTSLNPTLVSDGRLVTIHFSGLRKEETFWQQVLQSLGLRNHQSISYESGWALADTSTGCIRFCFANATAISAYQNGRSVAVSFGDRIEFWENITRDTWQGPFFIWLFSGLIMLLVVRILFSIIKKLTNTKFLAGRKKGSGDVSV
jgi:hypothetical protein